MSYSISFSINEAANHLVSDIRESTSNIRLVTGEANPLIWNDKKVVRTLELAVKKGVEIHCIIGPVVAVDKNGHNGLLALAQKYRENVMLYLAPRRQHVHYRIFDTVKAWVEDYHVALEGNENPDKHVRVGRYITMRYEVQRLINEFESTIKAFDLKPLNFSKKKILTLDKDAIKFLRHYAAHNAEFYDDYSLDDIQTIISSKEIQKPLKRKEVLQTA